MVKSDEFGAFLGGRFRTLRPASAQGVQGWRPDWRRDPEIAGGGILQDHGSHAAYLATYITGERAVCLTCSARMRARLDVAATIQIGYRGGSKITAELDWEYPYRHTSLELLGSRGNVSLEPTSLVFRLGGREERRSAYFTKESYASWFSLLLDDFRAATCSEEKRKASLAEAIDAARFVEAAYLSARSGESVWLA